MKGGMRFKRTRTDYQVDEIKDEKEEHTNGKANE
jgi:hypothetical protein